MEELKRILLRHAEKYPLLKPADAVKLIYQNEFGGGHLIRDREKCIAFLKREYDSVEKGAASLTEDIGNGICRVNLSGVDEAGLSAEVLADIFIRSAACHTGSMDSFLLKLQILREITGDGVFSFSDRELESYLTPYIAAGCPAVSHSEAYRQAYKPAYRIVLKELL